MKTVFHELFLTCGGFPTGSVGPLGLTRTRTRHMTRVLTRCEHYGYVTHPLPRFTI